MATVTAFGQRDQEEIKKTFEDYFQTVEQKDNKKTLDYIYPKLFEHFPKDKMLQGMNRVKADTSIIVTTGNGSLTSISEPLEFGGIKYALVKYAFKMTMTIVDTENESDDDDDENEDSTRADDMHEILKEKYGEKNIDYDRENSRLDIDVKNEMYAISDPKYKDWKFLEKKDSMKPVLEKLLPKKVLRQL